MKEKARQQEMRPMRFVYGVYGLTEWLVLLRVGSATLRVPFSGGAMSAYGQVPAKFVTTNSSVARLIEKSSLFTSGRIRRIPE